MELTLSDDGLLVAGQAEMADTIRGIPRMLNMIADKQIIPKIVQEVGDSDVRYSPIYQKMAGLLAQLKQTVSSAEVPVLLSLLLLMFLSLLMLLSMCPSLLLCNQLIILCLCQSH